MYFYIVYKVLSPFYSQTIITLLQLWLKSLLLPHLWILRHPVYISIYLTGAILHKSKDQITLPYWMCGTISCQHIVDYESSGWLSNIGCWSVLERTTKEFSDWLLLATAIPKHVGDEKKTIKALKCWLWRITQQHFMSLPVDCYSKLNASTSGSQYIVV